MSTPRRRLGTGPSTTRSTTTPDPTDPSPRLLPVERIAADGEHQEHGDPRARAGEEPVPAPGRRPLRLRGQ
ncbi:hypothetical protein ACIG54_37020 [Streptomyces achromogenes]|uniref:hypothetical protein n=1 Tax=Streptomyces achromogenes TaxID=67255 RepID=UPI0037CFE0AD